MSEEKKPKIRPQSLMAQNFSLALDSVFGLDGSFERSQAIQDKKFDVDKDNAELQELEARLRATEERLRSKGVDAPRHEEENSADKSATNANLTKEKNGDKKAVTEDSGVEDSDTPEDDDGDEEESSDESSEEEE